MILLVTASSRARECADAIEKKTHLKTLIASSPSKAITMLQQQEFEALVMDESFQQVDSGAENLLLANAASALPIYVNLALHGTDRVAMEVFCGQQRLVRERLASMRVARNELRNELRGEVTAILLNVELALREKTESTSQEEKLGVVFASAKELRRKLEDAPVGSRRVLLKPRLVNKQAATPAAH